MNGGSHWAYPSSVFLLAGNRKAEARPTVTSHARQSKSAEAWGTSATAARRQGAGQLQPPRGAGPPSGPPPPVARGLSAPWKRPPPRCQQSQMTRPATPWCGRRQGQLQRLTVRWNLCREGRRWASAQVGGEVGGGRVYAARGGWESEVVLAPASPHHIVGGVRQPRVAASKAVATAGDPHMRSESEGRPRTAQSYDPQIVGGEAQVQSGSCFDFFSLASLS